MLTENQKEELKRDPQKLKKLAEALRKEAEVAEAAAADPSSLDQPVAEGVCVAVGCVIAGLF